jgi:hypothetical protein
MFSYLVTEIQNEGLRKMGSHSQELELITYKDKWGIDFWKDTGKWSVV